MLFIIIRAKFKTIFSRVSVLNDTTDLNNTGSRMPKKMTNLEYQDGGRLVLQDVSASYEQYQKEITATKA